MFSLKKMSSNLFIHFVHHTQFLIRQLSLLILKLNCENGRDGSNQLRVLDHVVTARFGS